MWKVRCTGTGKGLNRFFGRMKGRAVRTKSTWLSPIVATITSTRGRLKRRRSTSSLSAPIAAANPTASTSENQ